MKEKNNEWVRCSWKLDHSRGYIVSEYYHFKYKCPRIECDVILEDTFDLCKIHGKVIGIATNKKDIKQ